jgi:hypothetical protein
VITGDYFSRKKGKGLEADLSSLSSSEVKKIWNYTSIQSVCFMASD